jgi:hypothetical protein
MTNGLAVRILLLGGLICLSAGAAADTKAKSANPRARDSSQASAPATSVEAPSSDQQTGLLLPGVQMARRPITASQSGTQGTGKKKESGEKGGTEDINIGIGELQKEQKKIGAQAREPRNAKESGEKGNTEDINIGVGELSKSRAPRRRGNVDTELKVEKGE